MTRRYLAAALAALCLLAAHWAGAEGSRNLYPTADQGKFQAARANLEWRTDTYGNLLLRRTLLHVYAHTGEYLLVGSSAVGQGSGDVLIYNPGRVSGPVGGETIPSTPDFQAGTAQPGKGKITTRAQELAGPQSADGTGNTAGYAPAYYVAPEDGLYDVVFYGPAGGNNAGNGTVSADIALTNAGDFNTGQGSSVAAWDVTVRPSISSTADENGRVFAYYLAMFTGNNGLSLYSDLYAVTTDGYRYQIALNGVDPNGYIIYGNQVGFLDSDGVSPLYHDVLGASGQVNNIEGGCSLSLPSYPLFFQPPDDEALMEADVATTPTDPVVSNLSFLGTAGGNNSRLGTGGTFTFTSNLSAVYDIVISRDNVNFDPTLPANRRLRGVCPSGTNTVHWDGLDNSGTAFPVGTGYGVHAVIHAGEYHFPLLDAENSTAGGPNVTLLNHANPGGAAYTVGFYDDRGYRTLSGYNVTKSSTGGSGSAADVGAALGGINPPATINADPVNGFNMSSNQRAYGQTGNSGNTNTPNTGSFGDTKGLDLWTYFPSSAATTTLNVQASSGPVVLLVKRITAVNGTNVTGFDDDHSPATDNADWPSPAATYLRGTRSASGIKPGDELEYTIYFLDTQGAATNVTLGDVLPTGTTFETNAFTATSGIGLALSNSSLLTAPNTDLTNAADGDAGTFYAPGATVPPSANPDGTTNTSGTVVVTIAPSPATLPAATGSGTPTGSYGFIRFKVHVN